MLNRNELAKFGPPGFNLGQKEKDYVQHWVLSYLSRSGYVGTFKGGTCLQKAFGLPRYSEDLDFTCVSLPDLDSLSAFLQSVGFSGISFKSETRGLSSSLRLRYRGPLYNGSVNSEGVILLEFSQREKTILPAETISVTPPYLDLLPYQLNAMNRTEIIAEKIRAVMTRESARDLFDLYFLLRSVSLPSVELINQKLSYYSMKFSVSDFYKRIGKLEKIWKTEISALTPNYVEFSVASKDVKDKFGVSF